MVKKTEIKSIELVLPEAEWAARLYACSFDEEKLGIDQKAYQEWLLESPENFEKLEACIEVLALGKDLKTCPDIMTLLGEEGTIPVDDTPVTFTGIRKQLPWFYGAVAACFALVVFSFAFLGSKPDFQMQYQTGVGEQTVYTLPDGSRVHMNTDTRLTLKYTKEHRALHLLRGEASFDVVRDRERPFDVLSGKGRARAIGTRFNVFNDGEKVTVSVLEGIVEVASAPRVGEVAKATGPKLVIGQQMSYDEQGDMSEVKIVDIEKMQAWQNARLEFLNTPLGDVVREMNRYSPAPIIIGDNALLALRVSGIFDIRDTGNMLGGLEDVLPVKLLKNNHEYIIVKIDEVEASL